MILWFFVSLVAPFATTSIGERTFFALAWLLTVALAYLSFRFIEMPIMNWSAGGPKNIQAEK